MSPPEAAVRCAVRPGAYYDSVVLMQLQKTLAGLPGVLDAGVVMATPANREMLAASGLAPGDAIVAGPHDLLIAIQAENDAAAGEALARVDSLLQVRPAAGAGGDYRPRSLATAVRQLPEAQWVQISLPGRYAAGVAREALDLGRNVFLYSDNVSVADEAALKQTARDRGLLVLGPDCGTALLGGTGFGFSNRIKSGRIGLIGASGTGLQAAVSYLNARGHGVSHAIGTGGRDLSSEVGGITALQALDLLQRDIRTAVIGLISKPPAPEIVRRLAAAAGASPKPVAACFLGARLPEAAVGELGIASTVEALVDDAIEALLYKRSGLDDRPGSYAASQRWVRGLFSGGTLALETLGRLAAVLTPLVSNIPLTAEQRLADPWHSQGHVILDLGADEFTVGRLHPMIDFDLRLRRLRQEGTDPEVALILLDMVLGDGAHADPAGELAPVIERLLAQAEEAGRTLDIAVLVIGTDLDPQDLKEQIATLDRAGARVCRSVGELVAFTLRRLEKLLGGEEKDFPSVSLEAIESTKAVINVGLETFAASLEAQGARVVQVDWKPPAGGDEKLAGLLERMKRKGSA